MEREWKIPFLLGSIRGTLKGEPFSALFWLSLNRDLIQRVYIPKDPSKSYPLLSSSVQAEQSLYAEQVGFKALGFGSIWSLV